GTPPSFGDRASTTSGYSSRRAVLLLRSRDDPEKMAKIQPDYEAYHGEAVLALSQFVEVLGGPGAPERDQFTLPLKTDRPGD
ncbi:MAG: hypothetical protein ABI635_01305, partial [Actinomycetota bacterium]